MKKDFSKERKKIGELIDSEIESQGLAIEEIERQSISKTIIYNIINGKGYTIDSLISVKNVLKQKNKSFKINI